MSTSKPGDIDYQLTGDNRQLVDAVKQAQKAVDDAAKAATKAGDTTDKALQKQAKAAEKAAAAALKVAKSNLAAGESAEKAAAAALRLDRGFTGAERTLDKVGTTTRKLGGFFRSLPGPMGDLVGGLNDIGDVGEVAVEAAESMGVSLGAVGTATAALTVAVGAGYLAWQLYTEEERSNKAVTDSLIPAVQLLTKMQLDQRDSLIDLRVARAELTTAEGAALKSQHTTQSATREAFAASSAEIARNRDIVEGWRGVLGDAGEAAKAVGFGPMAALGVAFDGVLTSTTEANAAIAKASAEQIRLGESIGDTSREIIKNKVETASLTKSIKAAADAAKDAADRQKFIESENERIFADRRARDKLHWDGIREGIKREEDAAEAAAKASEEKIEALKKETEAVTELADARRAAETEKLNLAQTSADALAGLAQQALQNELSAIDTSTKAGKAAALKVWETQHAVALATATTQAALGIAVAAASAPPPLNLVPIAAASVTGAANIASVAITPPPKFHMGTGEVPATLQPGEAVLTKRGAQQVGRENIERMNSGRDTQRRELPVTIMYQHRAYNRFMLDNFALGGTVAQKMNAGKRVGHREAR